MREDRGRGQTAAPLSGGSHPVPAGLSVTGRSAGGATTERFCGRESPTAGGLALGKRIPETPRSRSRKCLLFHSSDWTALQVASVSRQTHSLPACVTRAQEPEPPPRRALPVLVGFVWWEGKSEIQP